MGKYEVIVSERARLLLSTQKLTTSARAKVDRTLLTEGKWADYSEHLSGICF